MPRRKAYGAAISTGAVKQFGRPLHETQRYQERRLTVVAGFSLGWRLTG